MRRIRIARRTGIGPSEDGTSYGMRSGSALLIDAQRRYTCGGNLDDRPTYTI